MMRTTAVILLVCFAATSFAGTCDVGLWGENCDNVCIGCKGEASCDQTTGVCSGVCADGYLPNQKTQQCEPTCFGKQGKFGGCDNGGECVAPDYCICGKSGAQVVGVARPDHVGTDGKTYEGTQCISLRKDGIKGAFVALVVMVISIGFCGLIEVQRNKGKSRKQN